MNIGFLEASKLAHYDCIIFHDVDILPEDDRNYYICGKNPRHLAVMVEQFNYRCFSDRLKRFKQKQVLFRSVDYGNFLVSYRIKMPRDKDVEDNIAMDTIIRTQFLLC